MTRKLSAIVHVHSDWSYDGRWPITRLVSFFDSIGMNLMLTAEHSLNFDKSKWNEYRKLCVNSSTSSMKVIPGMEYSDKRNLIHILVWGSLPFLGEIQEINRLLRQVKLLGGVAVLAHPTRRKAWKEIDAGWSKYLSGVEIWNRKTDGWEPSFEAQQWLKTCNGSLLSFVGLDFHRLTQLYPLTMRFEVEGEVTEETVLSAIQERRCYPFAWGMPLSYFTDGTTATVAKWMEKLRKNLAGMLSAVNKRKGT